MPKNKQISLPSISDPGRGRLVRLAGGGCTIVDEADYELVRGHAWHTHRPHVHGTVYARTKTGENKTLYLHRLLMGPSIRRVDHRDGNGLNNRRDNLRAATDSQNNANVGRRRNNTSGFTGVSWAKRERLWNAYINVDGKRKGLGYHRDINVAAAAYDAAALKYFGEFARLNRPAQLAAKEKESAA